MKELNQILSRTIPKATIIPPNIITDIKKLIINRSRYNDNNDNNGDIESGNYYYTVNNDGNFEDLIKKIGNKYYILENRKDDDHLIKNDDIPRLIEIPKDKIKKINQEALPFTSAWLKIIILVYSLQYKYYFFPFTIYNN